MEIIHATKKWDSHFSSKGSCYAKSPNRKKFHVK